MVSRTEFEIALSAAQLSALNMLTLAGDGPAKPNVQVRKNGDPEPFLKQWTRQWLRPKLWADQSPAAQAAVHATRDVLERRLARAIEQLAPRLTCPDIITGVIGAHIILDTASLPKHNRFGLMSPAVWDLTRKTDPSFEDAIPILGGFYWRDVIWWRTRFFEEGAQAAVYYKGAFEGGITPHEAAPGQSASAAVWVTPIDHTMARVLVW